MGIEKQQLAYLIRMIITTTKTAPIRNTAATIAATTGMKLAGSSPVKELYMHAYN